jgi:hypothetical protein
MANGLNNSSLYPVMKALNKIQKEQLPCTKIVFSNYKTQRIYSRQDSEQLFFIFF